MSNVKISELGNASSLTGSEEVPIVQSSTTVKTTTQAIANLGGGGGLISKTVAQIQSMIAGSQLVAGQQYLLTDFATVHYIVDANGTQYLDSIITGETEPLIVTAASENSLDKNAISTLHPEDIIYYDWNPANWLQDLSFSDLSGEPTIIPGFKGVIYFRHDTLLDNYCPYDFRNCNFRRWKANPAVWDGGTTYALNDWVTYNGYIYRSLKNANINNTPANGSAYWTQVLNLANTVYWNTQPGTNPNGIPSDDNDFIDVKTFAEGEGTAVYEVCCRSNHFGYFKDSYEYYDSIATILSNHVFYLTDENYYTVYSNKTGAECYGFTAYGYFYQNTYGNSNNSMTYGNSNGSLTYGDNNGNLTYGDGNNSMTYGNNNSSMTYGNNNSSMTYGNNNSSMTYGNGNSILTYGNSNNSMTYGNNNSSMTYGNGNSILTYGNSNNSMTYGNNNSSLTYGDGNSILTYGNNNNNMTYGNNNSSMTYGDGNNSMTYGNSNGSLTYGDDNGSLTYGDGNNNMTYGNSNGNLTYGDNNGNLTYGNSNGSLTYGNSNNSMTYGNNNSSLTYGNSNNNLTFSNSVSGNGQSLGDSWEYNNFADGVSVVGDFSTATHVYAPYNCNLFTREGVTTRLSYFDSSDVLTVVDPTS